MTATPDKECTICLEEFDNETYTLKCKHTYCKKCIQEWLEEHTTCPLCRQPIEPLQEYVMDGIITADRLATIILSISTFVEGLHPYMNGFTEHLDGLLMDEQYQALLNECAVNFNTTMHQVMQNMNNTQDFQQRTDSCVLF